MAEATKTKAELLALYPDNSNNEISAMDLRDFVVSIAIYAELVTTGTAKDFGTTPLVLEFDIDGLFFGATPDQANNKIVIDQDGVYDIVVQGTAMLQNGRAYTYELYKNGAFECALGILTGDTNVPELSFGLGCLRNLVATDEIQVFVTASSAASTLTTDAGARIYLERKL